VAQRDIIVIGASAGGVETLTQLVSRLPADLPAALFIVLHLPTHSSSALPQILTRSGKLRAVHPHDRQPIERGMIYVAPPDLHLLIVNGEIHLSAGPRENGHRPAIDPLFRSAARSYGNQVVGVVLSGALDDGTAGLIGIKIRGGTALVQSPDEALYTGMPRSAIENVKVDAVLTVAELAKRIVELAYEPVEDHQPPAPDEMDMEAAMADMDTQALTELNRPGKPAGFGCPECGGSLFEINEGDLIRFRCRVGHAYSAETLLAEQGEALEDALWVALRALEERAALSTRMADRGHENGRTLTATRYEEEASDAKQRAGVIRDVLVSMFSTVVSEDAGEGKGHSISAHSNTGEVPV